MVFNQLQTLGHNFHLIRILLSELFGNTCVGVCVYMCGHICVHVCACVYRKHRASG